MIQMQKRQYRIDENNIDEKSIHYGYGMANS